MNKTCFGPGTASYRVGLRMIQEAFQSSSQTGLGLDQDLFHSGYRRGHFKALKFGRFCSQISEFYSSFSQFSVCRHRDYRVLYFAAWIDGSSLLLLIILLSIKQRKQVSAVKCLFCKILKRSPSTKWLEARQFQFTVTCLLDFSNAATIPVVSWKESALSFSTQWKG